MRIKKEKSLLDLPEIMKALVYSPEHASVAYLDLLDIKTPSITANTCLVKVLGCGVCGSDLLKLERSLVKPGSVLGHEMVGEIFEIPAELSAKYALKKGDRIVSSHHVPCGECNYCINAQESLCKQFKETNFNPGAFCEYLELTEAHLAKTVIKIENHNLDNLSLSFIEPLACCIKAIKRSSLLERKGKTNVLVLGLGSIGLIIGRLLNYYRSQSGTLAEIEVHQESSSGFMNGMVNIYGVDPLEAKRELACTSFDSTYPSIENLSLDQKPDFIFLSAGASACVDLAVTAINDGGTIVVFSSVMDKEKAFSNNAIYYKELKVLGSYSPNLIDLRESYEILSQSLITVKDLISHKASLENLGETIVKARNENGVKVYLEL